MRSVRGNVTFITDINFVIGNYVCNYRNKECVLKMYWMMMIKIVTCVLYASITTVYPKKYAHGFVVLCFVVVMQSFIINSHEVCIHIHQGCFAGTGAIVRLPQCQWSKPDWYGTIIQCITTTKHSKAKNVCIFLGIYCLCFLLLIFNEYIPAILLYLSVIARVEVSIQIRIPDHNGNSHAMFT